MRQIKFLIVLLIVLAVDYTSGLIPRVSTNGRRQRQESRPENNGQRIANQGNSLNQGSSNLIVRGNHPQLNYGTQEMFPGQRNQVMRDEFHPEDYRFDFDDVNADIILNPNNLQVDARVDQIQYDVLRHFLHAGRRAGNLRNQREGRPIRHDLEIDPLPTTYREFLQGSLVHPGVKIELTKESGVLINPQQLSEIIITNRNSPQEIQRKLFETLIPRQIFLVYKENFSLFPKIMINAVEAFITMRVKNPPSHEEFMERLNNQMKALRARSQ